MGEGDKNLSSGFVEIEMNAILHNGLVGIVDSLGGQVFGGIGLFTLLKADGAMGKNQGELIGVYGFLGK